MSFKGALFVLVMSFGRLASAENACVQFWSTGTTVEQKENFIAQIRNLLVPRRIVTNHYQYSSDFPDRLLFIQGSWGDLVRIYVSPVKIATLDRDPPYISLSSKNEFDVRKVDRSNTIAEFWSEIDFPFEEQREAAFAGLFKRSSNPGRVYALVSRITLTEMPGRMVKLSVLYVPSFADMEKGERVPPKDWRFEVQAFFQR